MTFKTLAAAAALALGCVPAMSATLDLTPWGLTQGALIGESVAAEVVFDPANDFASASVTESNFDVAIDGFLSDPTSFALTLFEPRDFSGDVVDFAYDADSATGLFFDGAAYVLATLTLPAPLMFDPNGFETTAATLALYEATSTTVVPLPAAAPMLLAGLGALAVATRRRGR